MMQKLTIISVSLLLLPLSSSIATVPSRYAKQSVEWLRSQEGRRIADNILTWQTQHGSWPKNRDTASLPFEGESDDLDGTFDNGATTGELRFLARAFRATNEPRYKHAFLKGLDHILEAQYPTGGWPQFYPPGRGYHRHITFNDNSMVRILEFLRDITESSDDAFLGTDRRSAARIALDKGIQCILNCQIVVNGTLTAWCAQHDEVDLRPRPARSYELESLSGGESAAILKFLMSIDNPGLDIQRAIRAGATWYESVQITGIRVEEIAGGDRVVVEDPDAPPIWARFYEIETNRPFFCGRDGIKKYQLSEIEAERRSGYRWYGDWAADLLAEDYPRWRSKYKLPGHTTAQDGSPWDAVVKSEYIFETAPFRSCHASTIAETEGGLIAAWFGGSKESAPDVGVWLSRLENGTWTAPVEVANGAFQEKRYSVWNPVLFQPGNGPLMLFYKSGTGGPGWFGVMMTSIDCGKTWAAPRRLPDGILGPIKNKPIQLADGLILCGSSTEDSHGWRVDIERTSDFGQTWETTMPLNNGDEIGIIQPTLLTYPDSRIQMLCRSRSEVKFIAESWSEDGGLTWSPVVKSVLPNNNSGIDGVTLADGRQLLVYNHSTRTQEGMGHKGRGILNVAISRDGIIWEAALILEHLDQSGRQFSYPAVIQTSDGLVHITYTWHRQRIKHVVLDPAHLVTTPMQGGKWPTDGAHSIEAFHQVWPTGALVD